MIKRKKRVDFERGLRVNSLTAAQVVALYSDRLRFLETETGSGWFKIGFIINEFGTNPNIQVFGSSKDVPEGKEFGFGIYVNKNTGLCTVFVGHYAGAADNNYIVVSFGNAPIAPGVYYEIFLIKIGLEFRFYLDAKLTAVAV